MTIKYLVERTQTILLEEEDFELAGMQPGLANAEALAREINEWETVDIVAMAVPTDD